MSAAGRPVGLIGVPTSAGAFAPGQEQAPRALRAAGLTERLHRAGAALVDHGDRAVWRWRPDRDEPRAQNLGAVVEIVRDTADRVAAARAAGELTLVLGGDCTVGIGSVAGHSGEGGRPGLLYFDTHADLNVPASVSEGALDWMGMAHMLAEPGTRAELAGAGPRQPLLDPEQVLLFAWGPEQATDHEAAAISRLGLEAFPVERVRASPEEAAAAALASLEDRCERLLVHFDVDVVDFTDTPLSENWGRNEGLAFEDALRALAVLLRSPALAGLTITELNPDHTEEGSDAIARLVGALADGLGGTFAG
ncbi:MAG TPA: arginase family protein [Solirubrobacterales bacterium]|nr:arginase family protein [Solirubrobacterales bacterium]